jgi:hypothetical protein
MDVEPPSIAVLFRFFRLGDAADDDINGGDDEDTEEVLIAA